MERIYEVKPRVCRANAKKVAPCETRLTVVMTALYGTIPAVTEADYPLPWPELLANV